MGRAAATSTASTILVILFLSCCSVLSVSSQAFYIDPPVRECLDSFSVVPGCLDEISTSIDTDAIRIGPPCCKAINKVAGKLFLQFARFLYGPFSYSVAPKIKAYCLKLPQAPAPLSSLV